MAEMAESTVQLNSVTGDAAFSAYEKCGRWAVAIDTITLIAAIVAQWPAAVGTGPSG